MLLLPVADMHKVLPSCSQWFLNQSALHGWFPIPCPGAQPFCRSSASPAPRLLTLHASCSSPGLCMLWVTTLRTTTQKGLCRRDAILSCSLSKISMLILVPTNSGRQVVTVPPPEHLGPERPEVTDE